MFLECIKEGFKLTHRNWQVILLKIIVTIISIAALFIFVGIPIAVAIIFMSIDIASLKDTLLNIMSSDPLEILSKYLGLAVIVFTGLILYITVVSVVVLYVFGGMLGVLRNASLDSKYRFSFSSFFAEAKKLFFPLVWLFSVALFVITAVIIIFGILTGVWFFTVHALSTPDSTLSVFVVSFFTMLVIFLSLVAGLFSVIFTVYASIALAVERKGVSDSFKKTWNFVMNKPGAFLFYILLVICVVALNIVLWLLGASFRLIPMIGLIVSIPYQIILHVFQSYLAVVMWSSLIVYFIKGTKHTEYKATYDI